MKRNCTGTHQEFIKERYFSSSLPQGFGASGRDSTFARAPSGLDLFHQFGNLSLALSTESAQSFDNPQPVFHGTVLIELLLAFEAKDAKFKTDNRLQLRVNIHSGCIRDLPRSR